MFLGMIKISSIVLFGFTCTYLIPQLWLQGGLRIFMFPAGNFHLILHLYE